MLELNVLKHEMIIYEKKKLGFHMQSGQFFTQGQSSCRLVWPMECVTITSQMPMTLACSHEWFVCCCKNIRSSGLKAWEARGLDMDGTPLSSFQLNKSYIEQCFHLENAHSSDRVLFCCKIASKIEFSDISHNHLQKISVDSSNFSSNFCPSSW